MVATADCEETPKHVSGKKVSKPLMEKKRRARINKCLDQLKLLLENYYSTSIRKRKLEKADILELTVNHLRNLQKIQSCNVAASELSDFQSGFRRCVANVDQYMLVTDGGSGSDRWMWSQLCSKLRRSRSAEDGVSTTDSGPSPSPSPAQARGQQRRIRPKAHDRTRVPEPPVGDVDALPRLPTEDRHVHMDADGKRTDSAAAAAADSNGSGNVPHMWRPW